MFMYFLLPHWVLATWRSRAQTNKGRVAVLKTAHHPRIPSYFPIQPLNDVIGTDASPVVLTGEIAVSQRLLNAIFHLLGGASFSFMERSSSTTAFAFSLATFLLSWAWIALNIFATSFTLERGVTENILR